MSMFRAQVVNPGFSKASFERAIGAIKREVAENEVNTAKAELILAVLEAERNIAPAVSVYPHQLKDPFYNVAGTTLNDCGAKEDGSSKFEFQFGFMLENDTVGERYLYLDVDLEKGTTSIREEYPHEISFSEEIMQHIFETRAEQIAGILCEAEAIRHLYA